jgi:bifunctional non-homologous end joining protein LigD
MKLSGLDPMPSVVEPMQPTLARQPFSNSEWLFEPKWDGFRAICFLQNGVVRFASKNRSSLTKGFPTGNESSKQSKRTRQYLMAR